MIVPGAAEITPRPTVGRVFDTTHRIRLADVDPEGRCRLDAMVRHLQDVARDDSAASGMQHPMNWVVRRTMLEVDQPPVFQESVEIATWCSGHGGRWAERRTQLIGEAGSRVEAVTVWVYVDGQTGAPRQLKQAFFDTYGATAKNRKVSARLSLSTTPAADAQIIGWALRFSDLDMFGHVNNAAQWSPVEEALDWVDGPTSNIRAELEHGLAVERGGEAQLRWVSTDDGVDTWLMTPSGVGSVARVRSRSS